METLDCRFVPSFVLGFMSVLCHHAVTAAEASKFLDFRNLQNFRPMFHSVILQSPKSLTKFVDALKGSLRPRRRSERKTHETPRSLTLESWAVGCSFFPQGHGHLYCRFRNLLYRVLDPQNSYGLAFQTL